MGERLPDAESLPGVGRGLGAGGDGPSGRAEATGFVPVLSVLSALTVPEVTRTLLGRDFALAGPGLVQVASRLPRWAGGVGRVTVGWVWVAPVAPGENEASGHVLARSVCVVSQDFWRTGVGGAVPGRPALAVTGAPW